MNKNDPQTALEERRKYVSAFNATMLGIWKEQIVLLGVYDTGNLYRSVVDVAMNADGKFLNIRLAQRFALYGLFQDYGTGREVPVGNPGDIGRDKVRKRRPWFSRKYYASVMNIREFFADNAGKQAANVISNALTARVARRFLY